MILLVFSNLLMVLLVISLLRRNRQMILTDQDTGLLNKTGFDRELNQAMSLSQRKNGPAVLALIDLDKLKTINDNHGHLIGNKAIHTVARHISQNIRPEDSAAKWGGDEYAIVFPLTDIEGAKSAIQRIRQEILKEQLIPNKQVSVSISVGLAKYQEGEKSTDWFHRADQAMYEAKNAGRDNIKISP